MTIENQHVVIIGGSSGIGLSIAESACNAGAQVTIASRSKEKLTLIKNRLPVNTTQLDILDPDSITRGYDLLPTIDHLIITAASISQNDFSTTLLEEEKLIFEKKFWGSFAAAKLALKKMSESGSITLFSGMTGLKPFTGLSTVTAACCAIEGLTKSLAKELSPIRVNAISPGLIRTPLLKDNPEDVYETVISQLAIQRIGSVEEIASAAMLLLTNHYLTGQILHIDGGYAI